MEKEPVIVSGESLVAALETITKIMKDEIRKNPELGYNVATVGSGTNIIPTLALVFRFDPKTMKVTSTDICSEKNAAKAWMAANSVKI